MMRFSVFLCSLVLVLGLGGAAHALPVDFDLAGANGGSSVSIGAVTYNANISAALVSDLDTQVFTLNDGEMQEVDFFTLTMTSNSIGAADFSISATLAFDAPGISSSGSGNGLFGTYFGVISGGILTWDTLASPDTFLIDGNLISVFFESGLIYDFDNTNTIHAYIKNNGAGTAPVPEPATMLLLGTGLMGLAAANRKRMLKKQ